MADLTVVVPAYNEGGRIGPTLRRIIEYLDVKALDGELVIVIDGCTDGTLGEVIMATSGRPQVVVLDNEVNRGKGFSVRRGMLAASGRFVLFSDADLSTPIEQVESLIACLEQRGGVAIASRALPDSNIRVRQSYWRQSMGKIFNWFVRRLALPGIHDSQCGFKCFPREVARQIFARQRLDRFAFDVEILWIARKLGHPVSEIPAVWVNSPQSKVRPLVDSARMLLDLVRIRVNDWRGAYDV